MPAARAIALAPPSVIIASDLKTGVADEKNMRQKYAAVRAMRYNRMDNLLKTHS